MKIPNSSTIIGYLGTILTSVLATMGDTHALALATPIVGLLNGVAGVLIALHVGFGKWLEKAIAYIERDLHIAAANVKAASAQQVTAQHAGDAVSALHQVLTGVTGTPPS